MRVLICCALFAAAAAINGCSSSSSAQTTPIPAETTYPWDIIGGAIALNGRILFVAVEDVGTSLRALWVTDGSLTTPELLLDNIDQVLSNVIWHDQVMVLVEPEQSEQELWITDGTLEGTRFLYAFEPGPLTFSCQGYVLNGDSSVLIFGSVADYSGSPTIYHGSKIISVELE